MENNKTPKVRFELSEHRQKAVILIRFEYDPVLIQRVKKLVGAQWSQSKKVWYVADNAFYRQKFGFEPKLIGKETLSHIQPVNQAALHRYIETLQLKAYSPNTIATYRNEFAQLLYILKNKNVDELDAERLRSYFLYCVNTLQLSENTLHSRINAVKFYYEKVLGRDRLFIEIPRPKKRLFYPTSWPSVK